MNYEKAVNAQKAPMTKTEARKVLLAIRNDCRGYPRDLRFDPNRTQIAEAIEVFLGIGPLKYYGE